MDPLGLALRAICDEVTKGLKDEIHDLKVEHHNAIDLFRNRFGELRRQLSEQEDKVKMIEKENASLKAAQQSHVASQGHVAPVKSAPGDDVRKELEQLKKTNFTTKNALQNQLGALQTTQKQQQSMLKALDINLQAGAQSPAHLRARAQDLEALKRHQGELSQRVTGMGAEIAALAQTHDDHNILSTRLEFEIADCKTKLGQQLRGLDQQNRGMTQQHQGLGQQAHHRGLDGIPVAVGLLQTAQIDLTRRVDALTNNRNEVKQVQTGLWTNGIALRHDVNTIKQDSVQHGMRLYSLEDSRGMFARAQRQQVALGERVDAAMKSVQQDIANITAHVDGNDTQVEELKDELLTVTRTLLGVIKIVRGSEQDLEQAEEGGAAEAATLPELQERIAPARRPLRQPTIEPLEDAVMIDDSEGAREPLDAEAAQRPLRQPTIEPLEDAVMIHGDDEVDPWEQIGRLLSAGDRTTEQQDIQQSIEVAPGAFSSNDEPLQEPQQSVPTDDSTSPMNESVATRDPAVHTGAEQPVAEPQQAASKKKMHYLPSADGYCHKCGTTESYRWMTGPDGIRTVCDPCGREYTKLKLQFAALANSDLAADGTAPVIARQDSDSSASTFATQEQKEGRVQEGNERSLKRKPALSPLKERFEEEPAESIGAFPVPDSPVAKLTKTGYDIIEPPGRGKRSTMFSSALRDSVANAERDTASPDSATIKRKRMNADEKAKMLASEFVADSGSEDGRKRRRTVASKTVRFDLDDTFDEVDEDDQGHDGIVVSRNMLNGMTANGKNTMLNAFGTVESELDSRMMADDVPSAEQRQAASLVRATVSGRGRKKDARKASPDGNTNDSIGEPAASLSADNDTIAAQSAELDATHAPDGNQTWDVSEDNIIVARPGRSALRDTEPVLSSPPRAETRPQLRKGISTPRDILSSEDELSLPTRFHAVKARSSYVETSVPQQATVMQSTETGEYRTLLSQFNLSNAGQKSGQENVGSNALKDTGEGRPNNNGVQKVEKKKIDSNASKDAAEGRPKRQPKPKKFEDMVDLRTLTSKDLGE